MDKKKKILLLAGAGILAVGIIILIFALNKSNEENNDPTAAIVIEQPKDQKKEKTDLSYSAPSEPSSAVSYSSQVLAYINDQLHVLDLKGGFVDTEFKKLMPFSITLENRDGNKLVADFNSGIAQNDESFDKIQIGDVMLYEGNKIVIFYKEVEAPTEKYTQIGNIEQLAPIEGNVTINFDYR